MRMVRFALMAQQESNALPCGKRRPFFLTPESINMPVFFSHAMETARLLLAVRAVLAAAGAKVHAAG